MPTRCESLASLALVLWSATGFTAAQSAMTTDPAAARFVYDDLKRFGAALERIRSGADVRQDLMRLLTTTPF